jgi:hypothetical protein
MKSLKEMLMTKNLIKVSIAIILFAGLLGSSLKTKAYPAYLKQAQKFGGKDCMFCHLKPEGGEGWNKRGEWLIAEKDRRKADTIDVEWLSEYKEGEKKEGDKVESTEKTEKKEDDKEKKEEPKKKDKP